MDTRTINKIELKNKTIAKVLDDLDSIMQEFDDKLANVYGILDHELDMIPGTDRRTCYVIDEIQVRILDDLPDRVDFMNHLWSAAKTIAVDAPDDDSFEEDEEEDEEEDGDSD